MRKNRTMLLIIVGEFLLASALIVNIYLNKYNVLGAVSFSPKAKDRFTFPPTAQAKYFYEFPPKTIWEEDASWMPDGRGGRYTINSDGINARQEYSIIKSPGTYRIIALGDSFTNGDYVDTPYNYPSKLEILLNSKLHCKNFQKFEVLNFGVGGYDIQYSALRYQLRGQKYSPDLVIWWMFDNDFLAVNELRVPLALQYEEELKNQGVKDLTFNNNEFYPAWMKAEREVHKMYTVPELIEREYQYLSEFGNTYSGSLLIFTEAKTGKEFKQIMQLFSLLRGNTFFYDGISEYSRLPDGHPTADSYSYIVDNLYNYLIKQEIIPCD